MKPKFIRGCYKMYFQHKQEELALASDEWEQGR